MSIDQMLDELADRTREDSDDDECRDEDLARIEAAKAELAGLRSALEEREADMHARIRADYDKTVADAWRAEVAKATARAEKYEARVGDLEEVIQNGAALANALRVLTRDGSESHTVATQLRDLMLSKGVTVYLNTPSPSVSETEADDVIEACNHPSCPHRDRMHAHAPRASETPIPSDDREDWADGVDAAAGVVRAEINQPNPRSLTEIVRILEGLAENYPERAHPRASTAEALLLAHQLEMPGSILLTRSAFEWVSRLHGLIRGSERERVRLGHEPDQSPSKATLEDGSCAGCAGLMKYIDAAKREAQKRGRVTGQPLAHWIAGLPDDPWASTREEIDAVTRAACAGAIRLRAKYLQDTGYTSAAYLGVRNVALWLESDVGEEAIRASLPASVRGGF